MDTAYKGSPAQLIHLIKTEGKIKSPLADMLASAALQAIAQSL
jgi:hypothetical protein